MRLCFFCGRVVPGGPCPSCHPGGDLGSILWLPVLGWLIITVFTLLHETMWAGDQPVTGLMVSGLSYLRVLLPVAKDHDTPGGVQGAAPDWP